MVASVREFVTVVVVAVAVMSGCCNYRALLNQLVVTMAAVHFARQLRNGCMVTVPVALVRRQSSHMATLSCGVYIILGNNG